LSELLGAAEGEPVQDELSAVRVLFELLGFLLRRLATGTLFTTEAQRHGEKHFFLSSVRALCANPGGPHRRFKG
jgi:hypothetical protein